MAFARLFFPTEAKLAMDIAHAETTSEFAGLFVSKGSNGNLREVDLNETPIVQNKRLRSRMEALMKTGKLISFFLKIHTASYGKEPRGCNLSTERNIHVLKA